MHHDKQNIEKTIYVKRVTYACSDSGWSVLLVADEQNELEFTAVGTMISPASEGEFYLLRGHWKKNKTYGKQLQFEQASPTRPQTLSGITKYLSSGLFPGIGKKTAEKIATHCKQETFSLLDNSPQSLLSVPGLSSRLATKMLSAWRENRSQHTTLLFLERHGLTGKTAQKVLAKYADETISILSENPYRLIKEITRMGFLSADKIAMSVGKSKDSPERIEEAIIYVLLKAEEKGHCFQTKSQLASSLSYLLQIEIEQENLEKHFIELSAKNLLVIDSLLAKEEEKIKCYYHHNLFMAETRLAQNLAELLGAFTSRKEPIWITAETEDKVNTWLDRYNEKAPLPLSLEQKKSVSKASLSQVFILTGGPGVGKTTTANALIRLLKAMGRKILLAAPTGRAAQRLSEVSQEPAKTIHRLLEWSPSEFRFMRSKTCPLSAETIIIDEASMLDLRLADHLIDAVAKTAQIILIGDTDQLPAIGAGNVLHDLLSYPKIPSQKLQTVFRQAKKSQIIQTAHAINKGEFPKFVYSSESDCHFIEAETKYDILEHIKKLLSISLPKAAYNPCKDVQILSPMNKGVLGCYDLNLLCQNLLNPAAKTISSEERENKKIQLLCDDKVIQTINNYDLGVFNGDIGTVLACPKKEDRACIVDFNGKKVNYDLSQMNELSLAYSITIHKSQGSEFPVVIIPLSLSHSIMLQRNLIYTALTRAKKLAIFIGEKKALAIAMQNQKTLTRQTQLTGRLKHLLNQTFLES